MKRLKYRRSDNNRMESLNLVSLMDIFTVLVFFILLSTADSSVEPELDEIKLPVSSSELTSGASLYIGISENGYYLLDEPKTFNEVPLSLQDVEEKLTQLSPQKSDENTIVILGDRETPFGNIEMVLEMCKRLKYKKVSLASIKS